MLPLPKPPTTTPEETLDINTRQNLKLTLISVINALQGLPCDEEGADGQHYVYRVRDKPNVKDSRQILRNEERIQMDGAASFRKFNVRITALIKEFRHFHNASGQLGSSTRVNSLAIILRKQLPPFRFLFQENAAELFPHKVSHPESTSVHLEKLPELFDNLAADLEKFEECLDEFREVVDDAIKSAIESWVADLKYRACCLRDHEALIKNGDPAVRRYVHDVMGEMGNHIETLTSALYMYIRTSIPTIRFVQQHFTSNMTSLSTIATFFSGVTATTLQVSLGRNRTPLGDIVNAFWFSSLIFSIAAAINSLLGSTWNHTTYRSPENHVPWWVRIWIKDSPLVFLVISVACFSAGLVVLPYSTYQSPVTSAIVTIFTAFTSIGFIAVSTWFAFERWVHFRYNQKWLNEVLVEAKSRLGFKVGIRYDQNDIEGTPPNTNPPGYTPQDSYIGMSHLNRYALKAPEETGSRRSEYIVPTTSVSPSNDKYAGRKGISRATSLKSKLQTLCRTETSYDHTSLVRHLEFSPDGKFLATSSWDQTSGVFRVGPPFELRQKLHHPEGFVGQLAWSPSGTILLAKLHRSIKVWTEETESIISRNCDVQSITWFPGGEAFMSIEGTGVTSLLKLDLTGHVLDVHNFNRLKLHDIAITPNANRLLGVGTMLTSPKKLRPRKSRVEKQIVVYNMNTKALESKIPVLNDIRNISVSQDGLFALVSYENKVPPQLWRVEMGSENTTSPAKLTLCHAFTPNIPIDYAGPSYFGGRNDELVLCAAKAGDLHVWDRESAVLLHHHTPVQNVGGDLTCVAWSPTADDSVMFATGSQMGDVSIWSSFRPDIYTPDQSPTLSRKELIEDKREFGQATLSQPAGYGIGLEL